jgi:hypothetical protein
VSENPLTEFVSLPDEYSQLNYHSLLSGVIRGSLEMVGYKVTVDILRDNLKGDDFTEFRVNVVEIIADEYEPDDD